MTIITTRRCKHKRDVSGKKMSIIYKDAKWGGNTSVEGIVAYFLNKFEVAHACIHAAQFI